jgi:hypothetical protein
MRFFDNSRRPNYIFAILLSFFIIPWISLDVYAGAKTLTVQFKENDVKYSKQKEYDIVSLPEFDFIQNPLKVGEPMIPVKTIRVLLPSGTEVTNVRIVSTKENKLDGTYYIYPIQYPVVTGEQEERKFVEPKKEIYTSDAVYPGKLAELYSESYFREYHIVELLIYPLQYKPAQRELTLNTEISFEIEYSISSKYQLPPRPRLNEKKQNENESPRRKRRGILVE